MGWDWTGISDRPTTIAPLKAVLIRGAKLIKFMLTGSTEKFPQVLILLLPTVEHWKVWC